MDISQTVLERKEGRKPLGRGGKINYIEKQQCKRKMKRLGGVINDLGGK